MIKTEDKIVPIVSKHPFLTRYMYSDYFDRSIFEEKMTFIENSEVNVLSCRFWRGDVPWNVKRRQINDNFLIYAVSGYLKVILDNKEKCLEPGEFMMIEDLNPHGYTTPKGMEYSEHIIIHCFAYAPNGQNLIRLFKDKIFKVENVEYWTTRLKELCCLNDWENDLFKKRSASLYKTLLQELLLNGAALYEFNIKGDKRIHKALQIIENDYDQDISIDDLANECGLQTARFRQLFKKQTRQSPRQYLINCRLKHAKQLLIQTDYTIQEIAELTGFRHNHYFCSVFKKKQQQTPLDYRNNPFI